MCTAWYQVAGSRRTASTGSLAVPASSLPVRVLSRLFRRLFLGQLHQAFHAGELHFYSQLEPLRDAQTFAAYLAPAAGAEWVVYAKPPFGGAKHVLDYLGRYTHRVALSNDRILSVQNGQVTLSYRDRKDGNRKKTIPLEAHEFIRRFLLHVLPDGFMRIRHFGFLANRSKKQALAQFRNLLKLDPALPQRLDQSAKDLLRKITGVDLSRCPCCHKGTMLTIGDLPARSSFPRWDSS